MATRAEKFDQLAKTVRQKTNEKFDEEIAELTTLSKSEMSILAVNKEEKKRIAKLMAIVAESSEENIRAAKLIQNIGDLGEMVVRVLRKTMLLFLLLSL
jgi:hypothetical protein